MNENEHLTRQIDLIPLSVLGEEITVIGAGAIGSWTTLALAKMGFKNLTVMDYDKVDYVNLNSQFFRFKDVGRPKVEALHEMVEDFTGVSIKAIQGKYEGEKLDTGIIVSAVDSMAVRKAIWEAHSASFRVRAVIDPRMGAETALLYVRKPLVVRDAEDYRKSLYGDSEALQERCTAKATIYTANMLSGLVCKAVKDILTTPKYLHTAQWDIGKNQFLGFIA